MPAGVGAVRLRLGARTGAGIRTLARDPENTRRRSGNRSEVRVLIVAPNTPRIGFTSIDYGTGHG